MPLGPMPPAGDDNAIPYNEEGVLAGDPNLTWDTDTQILNVGGAAGINVDGANRAIVGLGGNEITLGDENGDTIIGSAASAGQEVRLFTGTTSIILADSSGINITYGSTASQLVFQGDGSGIAPADDNVQSLGQNGVAWAEGWFGTKVNFAGGGEISDDGQGFLNLINITSDSTLTFTAVTDLVLDPAGDLLINTLPGFTGTITASELATKNVTITKGIVTDFTASGNLASGVYAPGSFTTSTGSFLVMANHLILTTTQQAVLAGTAQLRMI